MGFTTISLALVAISAAAALIYGFGFLRRPESIARSAAKTAAIGALAILAAVEGAPTLLVAALAFSSLGDLALSRPGERAFLIGLGAFLIAHLAYAPLIWSVGEGYSGWAWLAAAGVVAFGAAVLRWLWPHLGDMRGPVLAYVLAILAMGLAAIAAPFALWPLIVGAGLFIASDSILAAETFVFRHAPRAWTAPAVWSTYYAGQALIASAWLCRHFAGS